MPDIGKLLWPKSIAVVGASSDVQGLRGRILETILSHPFAGKVYPVSRGANEVQGLKAYSSVDVLPEPADLAILIIPAQYIASELERCGRRRIKAAVILSSGFAEEGEAGARMQNDIAVIARRYDMAVSGPNSEGFANIAAALCPTFSPAMDKNAGPIEPARALSTGQVSVISQSGGLGFAVFDRARPRNLKFRHIVTTGNEAALQASDFIDYMLEEGMTDGDIPHKTEAGAVSLNVSPENARAAYERVLENAKHFAPAAKIEGVVVQPMAPPGREVIVGISRDKCWGSLLMLGLGGVLVEALNDAVLAPVPLDHEAALALISRLKCNVMFGPYRGMQPADIEALADLIVKLSQFASDHADDIAEVDLNPVIVHGKGDGVSVADALILKRTLQQAERGTAAG